MFNLREYIKTGFTKAIGSMADYQIILNSATYLEKGVLTESDLAEIETEIENYNKKLAEEQAKKEQEEQEQEEQEQIQANESMENTTNSSDFTNSILKY